MDGRGWTNGLASVVVGTANELDRHALGSGVTVGLVALGVGVSSGSHVAVSVHCAECWGIVSPDELHIPMVCSSNLTREPSIRNLIAIVV